MSCQETSVWLDAFLDGELSTEETLAMEQHLATCETCGERLRFSSAVRVSVRNAVIADATPSLGFEKRLAGALRNERERILVSRQPVGSEDARRTGILPLLLAAATTFSFVTWLNGYFRPQANSDSRANTETSKASMIAQMNPEQVLDELVSYHAAPPTPEFTEPSQILKLEPEVGVPVAEPALKQFGASWVGGSIMPMKNQRAAIFRYRIENHPVTVYIYNARRVPLRGVLEPRVFHNQPIHVGMRRGYSIAAKEQHGVGYAIATDLDTDESAELVSTIY